MKKQDLITENQNLKEKLRKVNAELSQIKIAQEYEEINSILKGLEDKYNFQVDFEIRTEYTELFSNFKETYTLTRNRNEPAL